MQRLSTSGGDGWTGLDIVGQDRTDKKEGAPIGAPLLFISGLSIVFG